MNLILGICVGALVGWIAFKLMAQSDQGLRTWLFIGLLGGGIGAQLVVMFRGTEAADGHLNLFSLVVSAAIAVACLFVARKFASRSSF